MEKLKQVADNKLTWMFLGSVVGTLWGDGAANAVGMVGNLVMSVL